MRRRRRHPARAGRSAPHVRQRPPDTLDVRFRGDPDHPFDGSSPDRRQRAGRGSAPKFYTRRADLRGRTPAQREYLKQIPSHDVTFGIGPAGTGKTYLAVACAVDALERDQVKRIVLTRPAVEAGERLGFLPGDLAQKVDPYLRPLYDALYDLLGFDKTAKMFERQMIEIAPLAYMRGRTLNHAFIILDEAQNTTPEQMKMFLTRIGFGSKAVVTGDTRSTCRAATRAASSRRSRCSAACAASRSRASPARTSCAIRSSRASSRRTTNSTRSTRTADRPAAPVRRPGPSPARLARRRAGLFACANSGAIGRLVYPQRVLIAVRVMKSSRSRKSGRAQRPRPPPPPVAVRCEGQGPDRQRARAANRLPGWRSLMFDLSGSSGEAAVAIVAQHNDPAREARAAARALRQRDAARGRRSPPRAKTTPRTSCASRARPVRAIR